MPVVYFAKVLTVEGVPLGNQTLAHWFDLKPAARSQQSLFVVHAHERGINLR
jgi:hypothetical protein